MARVLAVDDDGVMLELLRRTLIAGGYEVVTAAGAEQALGAFDPTAFSAVVTDLQMPTMSGLELVQEVKRRAPGCVAIVVTGSLTPEVEQAASSGVLAGAFRKPWSRAALLSTLSKAVRSADVIP